MPNDNEDAYQAVLKALSEMSEQWRIYRDTVNRAINLLNHEVLSLAKRFDEDDATRKVRQQKVDEKMDKVDEKMERIVIVQEQIKRWQAIRLGIEIAAILIVVAFLFGVSR